LTVILDGRETASRVVEELKAKAGGLKAKGVTPTLALILVGGDEASLRYVNMKAKRCEEVGVNPQFHHLEHASQEQLLDLIESLNCDPSIHGIMVQLPLPKEFDELTAVAAISPEKDVDGLNPSTLGMLLMGEECFVPAGVEAIIELLRRYGIDPEHRHWVVVGLSNIVGKPMAALLANMKATVTCVQATNPDFAEYTRGADVLVVDVSRKWAITSDMVKKGAVVFDNGNNYEGKKVYGDVDFDAVKEAASAITPVPGGIGPLLITMLIRNTLRAAERKCT